MLRPPHESVVTRTYAASDEEALSEALRALRCGELVVFPTDTVYGVGCDLWQIEAIERLYWAKQRPANMAIPILVSGPAQVMQVASEIPALFTPLVKRHWPGGLSIVVRRRPLVPDILCAGRDTVAVRMPAHPLALRLIAGNNHKGPRLRCGGEGPGYSVGAGLRHQRRWLVAIES